MSPAAAALRADSPAAARAAVESLLRDRKLDRTLTTARPLEAPAPGVPFQVQTLDTYLHGGLPAGQLSEVVGPASSGRTSLAWQWMAAATRRGDTVALIDTFDRFDPASAVACGIVLERVLWYARRLPHGRRGRSGMAARRAHRGRPRHGGARADRALRR
jgi:hypothetical protein